MKSVIAPRGTRNVYEVDRGQAKSTVTVLFTFSAAGEVTPPMIVFPYNRLPSDIALSVPKTWGIGLSSNGWTKAEVFYEYISNVFYKHLVNTKVQFPVILFIDGHSTHLTFEVSKLCRRLNIILNALYPNSTRIFQPADVSAFKPIKSLWKKRVLDWRRENPMVALTKDKIALILERVLQHLQANTIVKGFQGCGIYSWNVNAIDYTKCLGKQNMKYRKFTFLLYLTWIQKTAS